LHIGSPSPTANTGKVGDKLVPMPHYGAILPLDVWQATAKKLEAAGVDFVLPPQGRFIGEPGEQYTMFFLDPSGNAIELKGFADLNKVFAS
jgi:extradiol dioxygenase family protein